MSIFRNLLMGGKKEPYYFIKDGVLQDGTIINKMTNPSNIYVTYSSGYVTIRCKQWSDMSINNSLDITSYEKICLEVSSSNGVFATSFGLRLFMMDNIGPNYHNTTIPKQTIKQTIEQKTDERKLYISNTTASASGASVVIYNLWVE